MKGKMTPQEKKRLSYDKDHRTHTGEDDRAMRKAWAARKVRVNRKYRRKTDAALRKAISPDRIDTVLAGDDGTTRELIRKGLTRERNNMKWGVRKLRDVVEAKLESRSGGRETNSERKERLAKMFIERIIAFEQGALSLEAMGITSDLRGGDGHFLIFLRDHPRWKVRLARRIEHLRKEEQKQTEKARRKTEQKRKWRSPTLRIPRDSE